MLRDHLECPNRTTRSEKKCKQLDSSISGCVCPDNTFGGDTRHVPLHVTWITPEPYASMPGDSHRSPGQRRPVPRPAGIRGNARRAGRDQRPAHGLRWLSRADIGRIRMNRCPSQRTRLQTRQPNAIRNPGKMVAYDNWSPLSYSYGALLAPQGHAMIPLGSDKGGRRQGRLRKAPGHSIA